MSIACLVQKPDWSWTIAVHRYGQYCPVARAAELLADRWTVLIVRELLADITHFNDLERGLPGISRSLLSERLHRLVQAGVLERHDTPRGRSIEYRLTTAGCELQQLVDLLGAWGARWAFGDPRPDELDPIILLWWMRRRVNPDRIPRRRVVIQFNFAGAGSHRRYWLLMQPTDASVCLKNPGFEVDLVITANVVAFYRVWLGRMTLAEAVRLGEVQLDGTPADLRSFPNWFTWSPMAETVRAADAEQLLRRSIRNNTTLPIRAL
ncbi:MAG: transcriptional regulator [Acetobacteraceae bacterium]|nr:transcriptional regulator [Acetobacteraceae bacterium]